MRENLVAGMKKEEKRIVESLDTAMTLGSGDLEVYATPAMVAFMEYTAKELVAPFIGSRNTTVGTHMDVFHVRATPVGREVTVRAEVLSVEGRKILLKVEAHDGEFLIGHGVHERVVVDSIKFMEKLS